MGLSGQNLWTSYTLALYDKVRAILVDSDSDKVKLLTEQVKAITDENRQLKNDMRLIAEIVNKY